MFIQPGSACKTRADRGLKRAEEDFRGGCHACARARSSAARLGPVRSILARPGAPGALRLCAPAHSVPFRPAVPKLPSQKCLARTGKGFGGA